MNEKLRAVVLEKSTDPDDWTADERRECACELYDQDKRKWTASGWISDAFSALTEVERMTVVEIMKMESPTMRQGAIGVIIEKALVTYALPELQARAEDREGEWIAQAHDAAQRNEADSLNDAAKVSP